MRTVLVADYVWGGSVEKKRPQAEAAFGDMIKALTTPLTPEEAKPPKIEKEVLKPVMITSESYESVLEKFNRVFLENRWGDGLPLIPPTKQAVKWMLTGTSRSPDEVIGKVAVKNGIATIEKIAINAVMAGAKPEYLPVIIAAMEGLTDEDYDLTHVQASAGDFNIALIVSGPIAEELKMNCSTGFLGHGWRANNSIGRAVRLCLINLGHMWPGVNDMASLGRLSAHTLFTIAENQPFNRWEPYHVIQGYKPGDSCVTVSSVGCYRGEGITAVGSKSAEGALKGIIELIRNHRWFALYHPVYTEPGDRAKKSIFLVPPEIAGDFQRSGFTTQKSLREYIYEKTRVPYEELSPKEIKNIKAKIEETLAGRGVYGQRIHPTCLPVFQEALKPGGKVPLIENPEEDLHFIVVGYPVGGTVQSIQYYHPSGTWTAHETKLIRGATLTKAGR